MKKKLLPFLLLATAATALAACGGGDKGGDELTGTAKAVADASAMSIEELEAASKAEMEANKGDTFKVYGLTSVLKKAATALANKYDWIKYTEGAEEGDNVYVNNGYKDYTLLTAIEPAKTTYVADFALTQDERSIADYTKSGILHNYVPSDLTDLGISAEDANPLKGIHFNKIFWTNKNFKNVTGLDFNNVWQLAGTSADAKHIAKVSFQTPLTEQINMSFLLSVLDEAQAPRLKTAYKNYYGKEWAATDKYSTIGEQWVTEFLNTVNTTGRYHDSDGSCMKQYQLQNDWNDGYVYFGAYSKMKDAAGKWLKPEGISDVSTDPVLAPLAETSGDNAGKVNAMKTVEWDLEIDGFSGYFYTMDSQIVNNAKFPYTACLFARYMLMPDFYKSAVYSSTTPNEDGTKGNQYGYYFPGEQGAYSASATGVTVNSYDRTKQEWKDCSIVENFEYLSSVKSIRVAWVLSMIK